MKIVRAGVLAVLVGLTAACAGPMQPRDKAGSQADTPSIDINLSNDLTHRYGESQIAVNPKNSNNLVYVSLTTGFTYACQAAKSPDCEMVQAKISGFTVPQPRGDFTGHGFNSVSVFVSFDRGRTWQRATVPVHPPQHPDLNDWGDPSVTAVPDGTFYVSWDDLNWGSPENALPNAGVALSKSTDGGRTWSVPVLTGTPVDGPKLTADLNTGTLYEASSSNLGPHATGDAKSPQGKLWDRWLVSSKDGVHWTTPQPMGGFGSMMTAAHGMLATVFKTSGQRNMFNAPNDELCGGAPTPCTVFETTKDGGATWSRHVMSVPSTYAGQPMVAADSSKPGHFAVALGENSGKEFYVYQTSDSGNTWSGPATVTDDSTKSHYHSWMAYSPDGTLGIMWRTRLPGPGQTAAPVTEGFGGGPALPYNVWAAISRDGGATFSQPFKVSSADSLAPQSGPFGNAADDYSSITLDREYAYVSWADWRPGDRSAFFRAIKLVEFKFGR
jgi:hypothetical protein